MHISSFISLLLGLLGAPLLLGVINRVKAIFAGRQGQPLLQMYYDLGKLSRKGTVYSRTTSWIFRANPVVGLACVMTALCLVPLAGAPALLAFRGDWLLLLGLLALMRFFTVLGALDTGSSFEGMGASREVQFSALAEPALFLALAVVARKTVSDSLTEILGALGLWHWVESGVILILACAALTIVLLAENSRLPVDDPNTHLELTMIHEVMVLDYSGPDFALILYGAALKLWLFAALLVDIILPFHPANPVWGYVGAAGGVAGVAVAIGVIESVMARLRLVIVPQLLVGAGVLATVALILLFR